LWLAQPRSGFRVIASWMRVARKDRTCAAPVAQILSTYYPAVHVGVLGSRSATAQGCRKAGGPCCSLTAEVKHLDLVSADTELAGDPIRELETESEARCA
jgi:hypothetical protein